jgi:hypothetical protein
VQTMRVYVCMRACVRACVHACDRQQRLEAVRTAACVVINGLRRSCACRRQAR